jgi:SOS-response transcriptional repressor LexA
VFRATYQELPRGTAVSDLLPFTRVMNPSDYYQTAVPLMTLEAAASTFGRVDPAEVREWVSPRTTRRLHEGMFVARVVGKSMQPDIPDGAYCLFGPVSGGSRSGRILLVQHHAISDPETGGSYTVKRYESEIVTAPDGTWRHAEVRLRPANPEFVPIVLTPESEGDVRPVAELIEVLG